MNLPRHPFRINIGFFINQPVGYKRDFPFEFSEITIAPDFELIDFRGVATIDRTHQGLRLNGHFQAYTAVTCGRCLEDFDFPLQTDFEELYTFPNSPLSENELIIPENGFIDLESLIGDFLTLEIPINPVCRADCKGLCKECGQNLNVMACEHQQSNASPKKLDDKATFKKITSISN